MLDYVVNCGTYGTRRNYVNNRVEKLGGGRQGKWKYLMNRAFLPMASVKSNYPFFYRHKALLPALCAWRIAKGLTVRWAAVKTELKALVNHRD